MAETYTATVDRIVDGETAVILLEADGETVDEITRSVEAMPSDAAREGMVLELTLVDGEVVSIEADPEEAEERLERNRERLERLGTRLSERDEG